MYTAFSPGTKNLFLVLSAACCIVAFFLMDAMRKEQKRRKWVCGILLCILVAIAVAEFHEAKQSAGVLSVAGWIWKEKWLWEGIPTAFLCWKVFSVGKGLSGILQRTAFL